MNYLIIGGVAGGATVAARLRRMDEKANIILFERGKYVSYANCGLPYYIGDTINNREKLFVQTAKGFTDRFRIDIRTEQKVTAIRPDKKEVEIKNLSTGETYTETYDKLVLSPGADPFNPELAQNGLIWSAKKHLTIIPVYRGQTGAATMAALYLCKFCVRLTAVKLRTGWGVCRDVGGAGQHPYRPCHSGQRRPGAEQPATSSTLPGPSCTNRICSMKNCWPATRSAGATWCGTSA